MSTWKHDIKVQYLYDNSAVWIWPYGFGRMDKFAHNFIKNDSNAKTFDKIQNSTFASDNLAFIWWINLLMRLSGGSTWSCDWLICFLSMFVYNLANREFVKWICKKLKVFIHLFQIFFLIRYVIWLKPNPANLPQSCDCKL